MLRCSPVYAWQICLSNSADGYGYINGERRIILEMQAYNGHPEPRDTVHLYGDPGITSNNFAF